MSTGDSFLNLLEIFTERLHRLAQEDAIPGRMRSANSPDVLRDIFHKRNTTVPGAVDDALDDPKLRDFHPTMVPLMYISLVGNFENDFVLTVYISFAGACAELSARHHHRGNAQKAAMYADVVISMVDSIVDLKTDEVLPDDALSINAAKAANARHAENRITAERIKLWYQENHKRFASLDAAAEAATRVEPVAFRTARKHIGAAAKEQRSASKA